MFYWSYRILNWISLFLTWKILSESIAIYLFAYNSSAFIIDEDLTWSKKSLLISYMLCKIRQRKTCYLLNNLQNSLWKFRILFLFLNAFFNFVVWKERIKFLVYWSFKICLWNSLNNARKISSESMFYCILGENGQNGFERKEYILDGF